MFARVCTTKKSLSSRFFTKICMTLCFRISGKTFLPDSRLSNQSSSSGLKSAELHNFIQLAIQPDSSQRTSIEECLHHRWMNKLKISSGEKAELANPNKNVGVKFMKEKLREWRSVVRYFPVEAMQFALISAEIGVNKKYRTINWLTVKIKSVIAFGSQLGKISIFLGTFGTASQFAEWLLRGARSLVLSNYRSLRRLLPAVFSPWVGSPLIIQPGHIACTTQPY